VNKYHALVREFQLAAKVLDPLPASPTRLAERHITLWHWLISEELEEWQRAGDIVARSHEQCDLLYVLYGVATWMGLEMRPFMLHAPMIQHGDRDLAYYVAGHTKLVIEGLANGPRYTYLSLIPALGYLHTNPPPGVKLWPVFQEIHRANMAKMEGGIIRSEGGKILKPEGWAPANIKGVLQAQGVAC
jgi:hypothetical protein